GHAHRGATTCVAPDDRRPFHDRSRLEMQRSRARRAGRRSGIDHASRRRRQERVLAEVRESDVIRGVYLVDPKVFGDERGFFIETYRREWIPKAREMIQANRADRQRGSVVGLHYHLHQADYWYVPFGSARMVLHDLRDGSPTDGATLSVDLGARADGTHDHRGVFIPPGVAHGFAALTDMT